MCETKRIISIGHVFESVGPNGDVEVRALVQTEQPILGIITDESGKERSCFRKKTETLSEATILALIAQQ